MPKISEKRIGVHRDLVREPGAAANGLLLLGAFAFSWVVAIGIGWVIWQLLPL